MKKAAVIGHFAYGLEYLDGQTIKTKIITGEMQKQLGKDQVMTVDTHGGWKTLLKAPFQTFIALKNSKNVLIFPAHNGLRIYAPLLSLQRRFFKGRKLHYVVIGGWLPQFLIKRKQLAKSLMKFDGIYVETNTMKNALVAQGFANVYILPNCKNLTILAKEDLVYPSGAPYRLCTFSRVTQEKGIETAVRVIKKVNQECGYTAYALDIYGQVLEDSKEWFEKLQRDFPAYIRYCGCVDSNRSVEVLRGYFALLFPTHFYTEGIPGTIIDAYAAGIPVISAKWESFADVVDENVTGLGYEFDNMADLEQMLIAIANNPAMLNTLKEKCLEKSCCYSPPVAMEIIVSKLS